MCCRDTSQSTDPGLEAVAAQGKHKENTAGLGMDPSTVKHSRVRDGSQHRERTAGLGMDPSTGKAQQG